MVWGTFPSEEKCTVGILTGEKCSTTYIEVLQTHVLPFGNYLYTLDFIFQQDNAPMHTSLETRQWLTANDVTILDCPVLSPDLNATKNIWCIPLQPVYWTCRQFDTVTELDRRVVAEWENLGLKLFCKLVDSIQKRCIAVSGLRERKLAIRLHETVPFTLKTLFFVKKCKGR